MLRIFSLLIVVLIPVMASADDDNFQKQIELLMKEEAASQKRFEKTRFDIRKIELEILDWKIRSDVMGLKGNRKALVPLAKNCTKRVALTGEYLELWLFKSECLKNWGRGSGPTKVERGNLKVEWWNLTPR